MEIFAERQIIGRAVQVPPARARELDVRDPIFVAELDLEKLRAAFPAAHRFRELHRFPADSTCAGCAGFMVLTRASP